jgi:hypothetical protein
VPVAEQTIAQVDKPGFWTPTKILIGAAAAWWLLKD